jgi:hypothetical protein
VKFLGQSKIQFFENEVFQNLRLWRWPNKIQNVEVVVFGQFFLQNITPVQVVCTTTMTTGLPTRSIIPDGTTPSPVPSHAASHDIIILPPITPAPAPAAPYPTIPPNIA